MPSHAIENGANSQETRDEWIGAVEKLVTEAETWSQKQSWAVKRDYKIIRA